MEIYGWHKTSLLDYPGKMVTTLFTAHCNFRCPYCHNGDLIDIRNKKKFISMKTIFEHLEKRKNVIDGVCITGGEPTQQSNLIAFLQKLKQLKIKIKLDTNGYRPEIIKQCLESNLIDYIAMDIKNSPSKYGETIGLKKVKINRLEESVDLISTSQIEYEFRTTVVNDFHGKKEIMEIAHWLSGSKKYCLQQYKYSHKQFSNRMFNKPSKEQLEEYRKMISPYYDTVEIRGV